MQNQLIGYRLSPQQARAWFLAQGSRAYRAQCAILLEGDLDPGLLKDTLNAVTNSYGILRTTFHNMAGMVTPIQVISDSGNVYYYSLDLSPYLPEEQEQRLERLFNDEGSLTYDYKKGPLFRSCLVKLGARKHMLIAGLPALCADSRTIKNLFHEIGRHYASRLVGDIASQEVVEYVQFSEWQNTLLTSEDAKIGKQHWHKREAPLNVLKLPFENNQSGKARFDPLSLEFAPESGLLAEVKSAAAKYGVSAPVFLCACWQILLWRTTGQAEIVTGHVVDGRKYEELQSAMGLFAKRIPIHCHFDVGAKLSRVISEIDRVIQEACDWQEYFIPEPNAELGGMSSDTLIDFEFEDRPSKIVAGGVSWSIYKQLAYFEPFKIKLSLYSKDNSLVTTFYYDPELFNAEQIKSLGMQYHALIRSAACNPEAAIDELEIIGGVEQDRLLSDFNNTFCDYPQNSCLHQLFEDQVEQAPDNIALIFEGQWLTYFTLNMRANQLANYLQRHGVGPETLVALCFERTIEMVIAILGVLKTGAAYMPLDPAYPKERMTRILRDAQPAIVLTMRRLEPSLPLDSINHLCLDSDWGTLSSEREEKPVCGAGPDNLAYVIYTSGSTGKPKGVMIPHRGVVNYLNWSGKAYAVAEGRGSIVNSPLIFDLTITSLFSPLLAGRSIILSREDQRIEDFSTMLCNEVDLSLIKITPAHLEILNHFLPAANVAGRTRALIIGGETLMGDRLRFWRTHAPKTRLINEYGPTETVVGSCAHQVPAEAVLSGPVPIGRPIDNTQIYILDSRMRPVPFYMTGELYVGGIGVGRGYLNFADRTAEIFLPNPYGRGPGARLYKTGDLARHLPDGNIECLGRIDYQVKIRGFRVELGEIEAVFSQHPGVHEVVVLAREDERGFKRLEAYFVPGQKANLNVDELRRFLQERLPIYMVPASFIPLGAFPLTPNGKVDRKALPSLGEAQSNNQQNYVEPRTPAEEVLAGVWSQVLGLERVGIHDNFFKLGGDSIIGIQIIARANHAGMRLTPKQLFEHQTIAELAAVAGAAPAITSQQGVITGPAPLTPIQHWFFERQLIHPHHFNQSLLLELKQSLDPILLDQAIAHLLKHHDALRLRFHPAEHGWEQVNAAAESANVFSVMDFSELEPEQHRLAIERVGTAIQQSLNLSSGPLLRAAMIERGAGRTGRLLLAIHHLAVDGVSWRILLEDLATAYDQLKEGEPVKLPAKTTSYRRWAEAYVEYAGSGQAEAYLSYWQELASQPIRPLPVDYEGGADENLVEHGRTVSVSLSRERTRQLLQEVGEAYHTQINEMLIAALALALCGWTGNKRVAIDMEWHGREEIGEEVDVTRTVGWFTAIYPVVLMVNERDTVSETLKKVKEQVRMATSRAVSYGALRYLHQDLSIREGLSRDVRAELLFNYLGQLDEVLEGKTFGPAAELPGDNRNRREKRTCLLEISASVTGGKLCLHWGYSQKLHKRETIEKVARSYIQELEGLIEHCLSEGAGGYTPSDFPLAQINQGDLDRAFSEIKFEG